VACGTILVISTSFCDKSTALAKTSLNDYRDLMLNAQIATNLGPASCLNSVIAHFNNPF